MSDNRHIFETRYEGRLYAKAEGDGFFPELVRTRLRTFLELPAGSRILDVGCGSGSFLLPLLEAGYHVTGLDFSPSVLKVLREEAARRGIPPERIDLVEGDATDMPFADDSFDAAMSFATLYVIPGPERALAEIARVVRPGGFASFDMGNIDSLNALECERIENGVQHDYHRPEALVARVEAAGLGIQGIRNFQFFPMWGGATPRDRDVLVPAMQAAFGRRGDDGRMLDEIVASTAFARAHAFRYVFDVRVGEPSAPLDAVVPSPAEQALVASPAWADLRRRASELGARGQIEHAVAAFVRMLERAPGDEETLLALADLYEAPEERAFVARLRHRATQPKSLPTSIAPTTPRFSVVLPTYNQARWLPAAIESVKGQTAEDWELIIVNDGSTDGTRAFLDRLDDPRIRVIHQENARLPAALNRGFAEARGRFLTWTSSDNLLAPTMLERLGAALEEHPEVGFVASHFGWIDASGRLLRLTRDQDLRPRSLAILNPGIAGFLYRADLAREVGEYDPELEGAEDWDMWIRLAAAAPNAVLPEVLYYYRTHDESMTARIPDRVRAASGVTHRSALRRFGVEQGLEGLYPELGEHLRDPAVEARVLVDLAARLIASPFGDPICATDALEGALRAPDPELAADVEKLVALLERKVRGDARAADEARAFFRDDLERATELHPV